MLDTPILEVRRATKRFSLPGGLLKRATIAAVDDLSLALHDAPQIVSIVGDSGSGKSTLARMALGLTKPDDGQVLFRGQDLATLSAAQMRTYRRQVQPVFQDPYGIYNPFYRIERVLELVIDNFQLASSKGQAQELMEEALHAVDLRPHDVIGRYPHQLSGGERQRVMLARIFLLKPKIIIADEPVSMIDVAVRTLFLNILLDFKEQYGISCLFITHNLANAYYLGGRMMVMCYGRVVEAGDLDVILRQPAHPYTQQLLQSLPSPDPTRRWTDTIALPTTQRPLTNDAARCVFTARCPHVDAICHSQRPPEYAVGDGQRTACFLYGQDGHARNRTDVPKTAT